MGITPKELRIFLRANAAEFPAPEAGKQYDLTLEQVEQIRTRYWELKERFAIPTTEMLGSNDPGLSLEDLANPSAREQFTALRRERAQRLEKLLRDAQMTLPQMSDDRLLANGRILSLEVSE